jgi:hypothetical protein
MAGSSQMVMTDARGRFRFDSVSPGAYRFTAQHPVLDSIGLTGLSARPTITDGQAEIRLAVPSFKTLWKAACGVGPVPSDSGIVYGTIRDASKDTPIVDARIELTWSDLMLKAGHHVVQRRWRVETRSNATGGYAVCGVALGLPLSIRAEAASDASASIDLEPSSTRVERRDLLVGSLSDTATRGTIVGLVTGPAGQPVGDARVITGGLPEVRTDAEGRFVLAGVPAGTRQVEVSTIGAAPVLAIADVSPGKAASVAVTLQKIVTLETVRSTAERNLRVFAAEFSERRRRGFGYARDSTEIIKYNEFVEALRDVPSLNVQQRNSTLSITVPDGKGRACPPDVLIDGARAGFGNLIDLLPHEVGAFEVYTHAAHIPARFVLPGIQPQCGMILVWTKYGLKNR